MTVSVHKPHAAKVLSKATAQLRRPEGKAAAHAARATTGATPHAARAVTARAPHAATVAQRRGGGATVQRMDVGGANRPAKCKHCNEFLPGKALQEDAHVKLMSCIFKSSLYVLAKQHRETDDLEDAVAHLHRTVAIAEKLGWKQITHVVMHIGPTKTKPGNSYAGYEHFHAFIVFDLENQGLERKYQDCTDAGWARNTAVDTELHGHVFEVAYESGNPYSFAIEAGYDEHKMKAVNKLMPAYFSIEFEDGKAKTTRWAI